VERYVQILNIALEAVFANKFRSMLTALGIIFGVAAVIAMMAIGNGAQKEILDQIKLVGVNNIIISAKNVDGLSNVDESGKQMSKKYSPGLSMKDVEGIRTIIPSITKISAEVTYETVLVNDGIHGTASLNGITPAFFEVFGLTLQEGNLFSEEQMTDGAGVCIIGSSVAAKYFHSCNPLGNHLKCGNIWLEVIGVLENRMVDKGATESLGIADYNNEVFAPLNTIFLRYKDRSIIDGQKVSGGGGISVSGRGRGFFISSGTSGSASNENSMNQLDKITVQVDETALLTKTAEVINAMLKRRHHEVDDYEIKVPELLLKQEQRTKDIFNIVLGAIASISLIVGGIGIMNIMLASVMERIREIGLRKAIGARHRDIVLQFLMESTLISVVGGLIGILLGVILARLIMEFTDILTIVSIGSVVISFGVSVSVGIIFGYMPAKKAAQQDAVTSLRHD